MKFSKEKIKRNNSTDLLKQPGFEEAKAIKLVEIDEETNNLQVTLEGMIFLSSLHRERKIKVISGPCHSGNNFLLNCFLQKIDAFPLVMKKKHAPSTKGIWIWNKPS